ncbi:MAG: 16S rRNA (uracil(1498)-N(3))-methyltransferase [Hyphomicrobiales bacterium]|nr:16S rRNA (uracil(1498)-N(3))-methyltransferase [Hyphomicrobiales bacterium]
MSLHDYDNGPRVRPGVRLFVDADLRPGQAAPLTSMQANYALRVMRLQDGAGLLVFNGRDGEWAAALRIDGKARALIEPLRRTREQSPLQDVVYLFAPLKRERMDYVVQKATEMGVGALRPVLTKRTVVERVNGERMRANVIEAAEQCGVLSVPDVRPPEKLSRVLDGWDARRRLIFCDEAATIAPPLAALASIEPGPLAVLIGPEGGFDAEERARLLAAPYVTAISLGPRVMRADTAAVAALALVNAVLGDWRGAE